MIKFYFIYTPKEILPHIPKDLVIMSQGSYR